MPAPWRRPPIPAFRDEGDTLVEVVIAMFIVGVLAASVLLAVGAVAQQNVTQRAQASEQVILRDFAEELVVPPSGQSESGLGYQNCATTSSYSDPSVPSGFSVSVTAVSIWNGTLTSGSPNWEGSGTCGSGGIVDHGLQQVTIRATSSITSASESMTVLKANL